MCGGCTDAWVYTKEDGQMYSGERVEVGFERERIGVEGGVPGGGVLCLLEGACVYMTGCGLFKN